jgi:maltose phosphorylase
MYLRTSRLDLDDYNREIDEGLHITSMAGSWLSVVEGFGGMRVTDGKLAFTPSLPAGWRSLTFRVDFRGAVLRVRIEDGTVAVHTESGEAPEVLIGSKAVPADGKEHEIKN